MIRVALRTVVRELLFHGVSKRFDTRWHHETGVALRYGTGDHSAISYLEGTKSCYCSILQAISTNRSI